MDGVPDRNGWFPWSFFPGFAGFSGWVALRGMVGFAVSARWDGNFVTRRITLLGMAT
jgi:hypothetical protein